MAQLHVNSIMAMWPTSNTSRIRLTGLFKDAENISSPTALSVHSRAMFKAAIILAQQNNMTIGGQFIEWEIVQTEGSPVIAVGGICQALSSLSNIFGIVGPSLSREVSIVAEFAKTIGIPSISYAATDPTLSNRNTYPAFYRMVPSDSAAAEAIARLLVRYNWTSCIIIYQNDAFGTNGANAIKDALTSIDLEVATMVVFNTETRNFEGNLSSSLVGSSSRIVVLWATSTFTSVIIQMALDANVLGPKFTWILSSSIPLSSFDKKFSQQLVGMLTVEPAAASTVGAPINTTLLNAACNVWQQYESETFPGLANINNYALFAFDATWLLIQALRQLCSSGTDNFSACASFDDPPFCFSRRFRNSSALFNAINHMDFLGVSGSIKLSSNTTDRVGGAYYFAQNAQPGLNTTVFVPVLSYDQNAVWKSYADADIVIWPNKSLTVPKSIASLAGVTLRIGVVELAPFTIVGDSNTSLTGFVPDLIAQLQADLQFIPDVRLRPLNMTYNQMINQLTLGDYDIIIADVTVTSERSKVVAFSKSIFDNSVYILMRNNPSISYELFGFMKPFSRNLWITCICIVIAASIMICLLEREENEALQEMSIISLCAMSWWYCYGNLLGFGVEFNAQTAAGRSLTGGLYMLSIVLVASYTANLASDLTVKKSQFPISGLDNLKAGDIPFERIGIRAGTGVEGFYLREISNGARNYYPLSANKQASYDALLGNVIDVLFVDSGVGKYLTNNVYCNLTLVGESFDQSTFGIVMPLKWNYAQALDVEILKLRESSFLDDLKRKWFETSACPQSAETTSTAMNVESMGGLFIVFGVIMALSFMLFAWNRCMRKRLLSSSCCKSPLNETTRSSSAEKNVSSDVPTTSFEILRL